MGPVIVFTAWKIAAGDTGALAARNTQCSFVCFLKYTLQFGESRGAAAAGENRRFNSKKCGCVTAAAAPCVYMLCVTRCLDRGREAGTWVSLASSSNIDCTV